MSEGVRDPRFYVVGGAIQPGRDCYLQRVADAELIRRVCDNEYCHVLAQPQAGKTSLAASSAARLREQDLGVAVVDLTEASAEDPSENAGRWYYSIVYRIARDLRLKSGLQSWWAERGGLTNLQRMREFFREIVLAETTTPIVVFFDRLEVVRDDPLAQDLLAFIRACYDARATVPEFSRLTFVMLGSASADELVKQIQGSPFEISTAIDLDDFSPQELAGLVQGLGNADLDTEALVNRVWSWTRGHPYLSQKVFRGLARRDETELSVEGVDDLVQTQFLAPATLREEPHMLAIAERLLTRDKGRVPRLNLYGRVRKGVDVQAEPESQPQHELLMTGIVAIGPQRELRVRNEIYAMVFSTRWVNDNLPFGVRGLGLAAAVLVCLIGLPVWYSEALPRPYIKALTAANQDYQVAADAYSSLASFPGYRSTAQRLFSDFLERSSHAASSLTDVMRINSQLETLPDGSAKAAVLLADFWERRAIQNMHSGDRDGALVAIFEALQVPGENSVRRNLAAELIGMDYGSLRATLRTPAPLIAAGARESRVALLDQQNNLAVWDTAAAQPQLLLQQRLLAEERLQVEQRRAYENLPTSPRLLLQLVHAQPQQVEVRLRAPSGQDAVLALAEGQRVGEHIYAFDFAAVKQLAQLLASQRDGNWTISVTDLERGDDGVLQGWSLVSPSESVIAEEFLIEQPVPEPRTSINAVTRLSADGTRALSWPVNPDVPGPVLVWDTATASIVARVPRDAGLRDARFVAAGKRVLVTGARTLQLWDSDSGAQVGQFSPNTAGQPRPGLSPGGRYAALLVQNADDTAAIEVWDLLTASRRYSIAAAGDTGPVTVDDNARYAAVGGRDGQVRVWALADGSLFAEFSAAAAVSRLDFDPTGRWLAVGDLSNSLRVWSLTDSGAPLYERRANSPWSLAFAADGSRLIAGSPDRAYRLLVLPDGRQLPQSFRHTEAVAPGRSPVAPLLLTQTGLAITAGTGTAAKLWEMPPATAMPARGQFPPGDLRIALSADGNRIAAGSDIADINIFAAGGPGGVALATRKPLTSDDAPSVEMLEFSPDRRLLAGGAADGTVHLWETVGAVPRNSAALHTDGAVHDLLFSDDGSVLFSASRREVQVTDTRTGETVARLRIQADSPQLAYAQSAEQLFVAGDEAGVTRWDWRSGVSEAVVGGEAQVTKVATTDTGRRIVTADIDSRLRLWDVERRLVLDKSMVAAATVDDLWLLDDGRRLLVQAGNWLHAAAILPVGLAARETRFLDMTPAAAQPDLSTGDVTVLAPAPGRAKTWRVRMTQPPAGNIDGDTRRLKIEWQQRLAMTLDAQGRSQPLVGNGAKPPE